MQVLRSQRLGRGPDSQGAGLCRQPAILPPSTSGTALATGAEQGPMADWHYAADGFGCARVAVSVTGLPEHMRLQRHQRLVDSILNNRRPVSGPASASKQSSGEIEAVSVKAIMAVSRVFAAGSGVSAPERTCCVKTRCSDTTEQHAYRGTAFIQARTRELCRKSGMPDATLNAMPPQRSPIWQDVWFPGDPTAGGT